VVLPQESDIELFAQKASQALHGLNFEAKREIVRGVIEKVVGTQKELHISGYIPVTHVNVHFFHRHGVNTIGHGEDQGLIPFELNIKLPDRARSQRMVRV
jgi:hypothetical protein